MMNAKNILWATTAVLVGIAVVSTTNIFTYEYATGNTINIISSRRLYYINNQILDIIVRKCINDPIWVGRYNYLCVDSDVNPSVRKSMFKYMLENPKICFWTIRSSNGANYRCILEEPNQGPLDGDKTFHELSFDKTGEIISMSRN
jgi:hypothetical protein